MSKRRAAAGGVILATGIAALGGTTAFADSGEPVQQPPQPEPQQHTTDAQAPQGGGLVNANVPLALDLHEGVANDLNAEDAVHDVVRVGDVIPAEKTNVSGDHRGGEQQEAPQKGGEQAPASTTSANAGADTNNDDPGKGGGNDEAPQPPEAQANANAGGGEATANAVSDIAGSVDGVASSAQSSLKPTVDGVTSSASSTVSGVLDLSGGNGDNCPK